MTHEMNHTAVPQWGLSLPNSTAHLWHWQHPNIVIVQQLRSNETHQGMSLDQTASASLLLHCRHPSGLQQTIRTAAPDPGRTIFTQYLASQMYTPCQHATTVPRVQ